MNDTVDARAPERMPTGIAGLDDILGGGLIPQRLYLIEGSPGTGKTTLALQFLLEGVRRGEPGLFVTLSESKAELRASAESHGWSLDELHIFELTDIEGVVGPDANYTVFHPAEVELTSLTKAVLAEVERVGPVRVVFDSLSELRLIAQDPLRYRRQILEIKQFFVGRGCTVLLTDEDITGEGDRQLQSLAHGVVMLEHLAPEYGGERRRLRVLKVRGMTYRGGYHDFRLVRGGLAIYPRLVAQEHPADCQRDSITSGLAQLDVLLGGGLERGTSSLIMGPSGSGKSSIATQFAFSAAARGEHVAIFTLDESRAVYLARAAGMGMDLKDHLEGGRITVQQIDPSELTPGEFSQIARRAITEGGVRLIVIDSLNGYLSAMAEERFLGLHLHELLSYLGQQGTTTLLVLNQQGLMTAAMQEALDASYIADAVILLRYFETGGELRKAISVVKKRTGRHERTIHELRSDEHGLSIGEPLRDMEGIMSGAPGSWTK